MLPHVTKKISYVKRGHGIHQKGRKRTATGKFDAIYPCLLLTLFLTIFRIDFRLPFYLQMSGKFTDLQKKDRVLVPVKDGENKAPGPLVF